MFEKEDKRLLLLNSLSDSYENLVREYRKYSFRVIWKEENGDEQIEALVVNGNHGD